MSDRPGKSAYLNRVIIMLSDLLDTVLGLVGSLLGVIGGLL
jgi:hypothetical protein